MNNKKRILICASLVAGCVFMAASGSALAKGDPAKGKEKSATCQACHGQTGVSPSPQFPTIAGQYETYLEHALEQYRSGDRKNAIMAGMAQPLSDEDIADLAAWYASQDGLKKTPVD